MVDVNNALSKIVQHCLGTHQSLSYAPDDLIFCGVFGHCAGFESIMDDFIELIRNKKTPPHGKVSIMDFLTTMLRGV